MEAVFAGTGVTTVVVGPEVGQASAAKQAYALFNKGRVVLAALADRLAQAHGVRHVLEAEGRAPDAELLGELDEVRDGLTEVGWRWGPEMDELALTLTEAGLDPTVVDGLGAELRRRAR